MKLPLAVASILLLSTAVDTVQALDDEGQAKARFLSFDGRGDVFLENNSLFLCATKLNGASVGFRDCSYSTHPAVQMWRFETDGTVRSLADNQDRCWIINDGQTVGDGRLWLTDCDSVGDSSLAQFSYKEFLEDLEGQILVDAPSGETLCLSSVRGTGGGDDFEDSIIFALECEIFDSFLWIHRTPRYFMITPCIVPRNDKIKTRNGLELLLNCNQNNPPALAQWWQDGNGLIHTRDKPDMCLQAGHGKELRDGSYMRLYPCDKDNEYQRFRPIISFDGSIQLEGRPDLCVVFRGTHANMGDPIIVKLCDKIGTTRARAWTAPSVDD